jgi:hypothetical protein
VREQSTTKESVAFVLDQLFDAESLPEAFENLEVLYTCMIYASQHFKWPTTAEIAATSGLDVCSVLNVEERLEGTYEFALRTGLIEEHG